MPVALGVAFEVFATFLGTVGKQLISFSGRVKDQKRANLLKFSGLVITTLIGPVVDMAAYAFAPQAIIAPLAGLDIVWNTMSAPITLGERLSARHVVGSTLVFLGAMLTAMLGPHSETQATQEWLDETFNSLRFLSYCIVFGVAFAIGAVVLQTRPKGVGDKARGLALGLMAGGIAGNMFFMSASLGLLRSSASSGDWSVWRSWMPYVLVLGAVSMAVLNIPFMSKALQEYEALFAVTLFEGCHILVACVSGAWVLRELDREAFETQSLYWMAVSVIFCGLLVIQRAVAGNAKPKVGDGRALRDVNSNPSANSINAEEEMSPPYDHPLQANGAHAAQPALNDSASRTSGDHDARSSQVPTAVPGSGELVVWAGSLTGIGSSVVVDPEELATSDTEGDSSDAADDTAAE
uniref:Uncharacterized protein n=1 Tax=Zooxanthella nutricula TaxID=1333877 RepID=A0A7S2N1J6_9DINO